MRTFAIAAVIAAGLAGSAGAATLLSDNFDDEVPQLNTELDNWNVTRGSVDVIGCPGSGLCVDLDGSRGATPATIMSSRVAFSIEAGNTYTVDFRLDGGNTDPFTVSLGSVSQIYIGFSNTLSASFSFVAAMDEMSPLTFSLNTLVNDNFGPYLTDVTLSETVAVPPVPLPAGGLLLMAGLGALTFVRRR